MTADGAAALEAGGFGEVLGPLAGMFTGANDTDRRSRPGGFGHGGIGTGNSGVLAASVAAGLVAASALSFGPLEYCAYPDPTLTRTTVIRAAPAARRTTVKLVRPQRHVGPAGYGSAGFVAAGTLFPYRITSRTTPPPPPRPSAWTSPTSSTPNLDWSTFQLTEVGFGDTNLTIPAGSQHYQTTVPMTYNGQTFDVLIELDFDAEHRPVHARPSSRSTRTPTCRRPTS